MDIEDSDTAHNVDSRTETNSRISTEPEIKEESSEHIPEETNSNTVITEVDSAKETDPSIISTDDSNKGDPTTQSVLQKAEETSQLNIEQEEDAQIAKPETEIPLKEKTETPCNQESDPSNNVLKSVVETTITENDLITTSVHRISDNFNVCEVKPAAPHAFFSQSTFLCCPLESSFN